MMLSPLHQRRWRNFRRNGRAFWSLVIFTLLFVASLFAELIANDKPILVQYRGEYFVPAYRFYPETAFGGDFGTEANYKDPVVACLIASGGVGTLDHFVEGVTEGHASAVLAASIFHFGTFTVGEAKAHMAAAGIPVRLS